MPDSDPHAGTRRLGQAEFVAMMALIFALVALTIDAMLPASPQIAAELVPDAPNEAQLVLTVFLIAMGVGTFFTGALSDAFGRKRVITVGIGIYILGALLAWRAPTLDTLLAARALQGIGASAPRVVGNAMIRDLFEGRHMAQITSFVMTVFMIVPAMAPSLGQLVMLFFDWRVLFLVFVLIALIAGTWMNVRQPETLPPERRRRFTVKALRGALMEVLRNRLAMLYVWVLMLAFGSLYTQITSIQLVYDQTFGRASTFALWFMASAVVGSLGTVLNAVLVIRLGMRLLVSVSFAGLFGFSALYAVAFESGIIPDVLAFPVFFVWTTLLFFLNGMIAGNLNALALQPLGHVAGMAASLIAAFSTVGSAILSLPFVLSFDGTQTPMVLAVTIFSGGAWFLMRGARDAPPAPTG